MGLSITDTLALVGKGYSVSEIQKVSAIINTDQENGNNIIELAKKLKYSDFEQAMTLFAKPDSGKPEDNKGNEPDNNPDDSGENQNKNASGDDQNEGDDQGAGDDVDYKKLYEEEKSLRQKLQQINQNKGKDTDDKKMSDWDIALQAASDVLN